MNKVSHSDFDSVTGIMCELGEYIVNWRDDEDAKKLYSKGDFKTNADRRAHKFLNEKLGDLYPGIPIISEEDNEHPEKRPDCYWLIDPIDGTASWYGGFDGFVTQAAYIEENCPLFGIVHSPILGYTWTAVRGDGGRLNGAPLEPLKPSERLIIIDNTPQPHGIVAHLMKKMRGTGYYESGSIGLKSALVADGTVDLFVKPVVVRDWDIAPVAVLLEELGGCFALPSGAPFIFDGSMTKTDGIIVARDKELLACAVEALAKIETFRELI